MERSLLNGNLMNWNYRLSLGSEETMCLQREKRKDKNVSSSFGRRVGTVRRRERKKKFAEENISHIN